MNVIDKLINEFLATVDDQDFSQKELDEKFNEFLKEKNLPFVMPEEDYEEEEDAYDYLEMAADAKSVQEALKYSKKALKLDPDNIDAQVAVAESSIFDQVALLNKYDKIKKDAELKLTEEGFFSGRNVGDFWHITDTRPYMRMIFSRMQLMIECGRFSMAKEACVEILRLNNYDNLGARFILMHLYAFFEDENSALELFKRYGSQETTQFLLPLSILYFKLGNTRKAANYLRKLNSVNKDIHRFLICLVFGEDLPKFDPNTSEYRPNTIEEIMVEVSDNNYLFLNLQVYYKWALKTIKKIN